jgi:hypothetical protein
MMTVEDTIEILAGLRPRKVNIRVDAQDIKLITSLGRQIAKKIALTDRQLDLSLKKIEKYRSGLEKCDVAVDEVLSFKTLKWPLRVIDRTQSIWIDTDPESKKPVIMVKYVFSKKFAENWSKIEESLSAYSGSDKSIKRVAYTERNLYSIVKGLESMEFTVTDEIQEICEKIEKILENPDGFAPYLDYEDGKLILKNSNAKCEETFSKKVENFSDNNILEYVNYAKSLGIPLKSRNLLKKISEISEDTLARKVSYEYSSRYRINPENYSLTDLISTIDTLNQWPLVVVVEENNQIFDTVKTMVTEFAKFVPKEKMNVFFRLKNEQTDSQQFNQFVKDNNLNNYIDSTTKVVFILRTRIPKPLLKAAWSPTTAIITSTHDFGRMSAYLNDFSTVYYYNNSVTMRTSRLKGADKIVQL